MHICISFLVFFVSLFHRADFTLMIRRYQLRHSWLVFEIVSTIRDIEWWQLFPPIVSCLTHWGRVTHIFVSKLTIIGSDNGLSPGRRQAIIWTNAGILLIGPLGTNFNEILIEIHIISFKKMHLKMSSAKWRPFCLGLNVFIPMSTSENNHVDAWEKSIRNHI